MSSPADPVAEAARRRTFAIISHPDAGKTTLTEKLLLYGGALGREAGAVKAKGDRRSATSDWMELEQRRGISITSTVLHFPYRDCVVNLLDTPGHRDFSEDTYRVLTACDAAVMVLDAAKGIEAQTLKLFEVLPQPGPADPDVREQVGPTRPEPARGHRRHRGQALAHVHPGHLAGRNRRRLPGCGRPPRRRVHPLHPHRTRLDRGARGARRPRPGPDRGGQRLERGARRARAALRRDARPRAVSARASRPPCTSARRSPTSASGCCSTR